MVYYLRQGVTGGIEEGGTINNDTEVGQFE
jgi:hypothetical protein